MKKFKLVSKETETTASPKAKVIQEIRSQEQMTEADEVISHEPLSRSEEKSQILPASEGLKCACGEPVALGQHAVCIKHIRTN